MADAAARAHPAFETWDVSDVLERRKLLELLSLEPEKVLTDIAGELGVDIVPIVIEALAVELVRTSVLVEELEERVAELTSAS